MPGGADPNVSLLKMLDPNQLLYTNDILISQYKTELFAMRDNSQFVCDFDDGVPLAHFRQMKDVAALAMRQKLGLVPQPWEGPPLKHRPGRLRWTLPGYLKREEANKDSHDE